MSSSNASCRTTWRRADIHVPGREKSFRDHLAAWGANNKNLNEKVVAAIVRKRKARDELDKDSEIQFRGRVVQPEQVERYIARRKKYTEEYLAQIARDRAPTPDGLEVFTPRSISSSPSPLEEHHVPERLLASIRTFFLGTLNPASKHNSSEWVYFVECDEIQYSRQCQLDELEAETTFTFPHDAGHNAYDWTREHWFGELMERVRSIVVKGAPHALQSFLKILGRSQQKWAPNVFDQVVNFYAKVCLLILGVKHPFSVFCSQLARLPAATVRRALVQAEHVFADATLELGELHQQHLYPKFEFLLGDQPYECVSQVQDFISRYEAQWKPHDERVIMALHRLAAALRVTGDLERAEHTYRDLIRRAEHLQDIETRSEWFNRGHAGIARCRETIGDRAGATNHMWEAIKLQTSQSDRASMFLATTYLRVLRQWQFKWGETEAAEGLGPGVAMLAERAGMRTGWIKCEDPDCTEEVE